MVETLRILIAGGLALLLVLLRLEAESFGAAEYDEPGTRRRHPLTVRLSWYALGFVLLAAIYVIHPQPHDVLNLVVGRRTDAIVYGLAVGILGVLQAVAFAMYRYRDLRLPAPEAYPGAALNAVATSIVDEAAFRGVLLGMLIAIGVPGGFAVVIQAILYALATRLGAPGRHPYMLALALGIGLVCGWATIHTGGIGAAVFGHAVTSFALFVCTGHPGQVRMRGNEPEELARLRQAPAGWREAGSAARQPGAAGRTSTSAVRPAVAANAPSVSGAANAARNRPLAPPLDFGSAAPPLAPGDRRGWPDPAVRPARPVPGPAAGPPLSADRSRPLAAPPDGGLRPDEDASSPASRPGGARRGVGPRAAGSELDRSDGGGDAET